MNGERHKKMAMLATVGLLTLALAGSPARAQQNPDPATPLVTTFAAGALLNYDRAAQHYRLYLGKDAAMQSPGGDEYYAGSSSEDYAETRFFRL